MKKYNDLKTQTILAAFITIFSGASAAEPTLKEGFPFTAFVCDTDSFIYNQGSQLNVVIENVDDDDNKEIVLSTTDSQIYAINADGSVVNGWPFVRPNSDISYLSFAKLTDGGLNNLVTLFDAFDTEGNFLFEQAEVSSMDPASSFDVDNDGYDEMFSGSHFGGTVDIHGLNKSGVALPNFPLNLNHLAYGLAGGSYSNRNLHTPVYSDLDLDGDIEIISASPSHLFAIHHDGRLVKGFPVEYNIPDTRAARSFIAVGDVDGDTFPEIVVADRNTVVIVSNVGVIQTTSELTGDVTWGTAPALADLDGDFYPEIIIQTDGYINVFKGSGKNYSGWPVALLSDQEVPYQYGKGNGSPVIGDINADGSPDILIVVDDTYSHANSGAYAFSHNGIPIDGFPILLPIGAGAVPAIADIDSDQKNEVIIMNDPNPSVYCGTNELVWVYDIDQGVTSEPQWGQFLQNSKNQGGFVLAHMRRDDDSDGMINFYDKFPGDSSEWLDTDLDGIGNNNDDDDDNDGTPDAIDVNPIDVRYTSGMEQLHKVVKANGEDINFRTENEPLNSVFITSAVNTEQPFTVPSIDIKDKSSYDLSIKSFESSNLKTSTFSILIGENGHYGNENVEFEFGTSNLNGRSSDDILLFQKEFSNPPVIFFTPYRTTTNNAIITKAWVTDEDSTSLYYYDSVRVVDQPYAYFAIDTLLDEGVLRIRNQDIPFELQRHVSLLEGWNEFEDFAINVAAVECTFDEACQDRVNVNILKLGSDFFIADSAGPSSDGSPGNHLNSYFNYIVSTNDLDSDNILDVFDDDIDGDGIVNELDRFPHDIEYSSDMDNDGMPDLWEVTYQFDQTDSIDSSLDFDNDGLSNFQEYLSGTNPTVSDSDLDGVMDGSDDFPTDEDEYIDFDKDGIADNRDEDDDNDGVMDSIDIFPNDTNESQDNDGDFIGDNSDQDDDNDGVPDENDAFPFEADKYLDSDFDGIADAIDSDDDNDLLPDEYELQYEAFDFSTINPNETNMDHDGDGFSTYEEYLQGTSPVEANVDTDGDGIVDEIDTDDDGDGVIDSQDAFPLDPTRSTQPEEPLETGGGGGGGLPYSLLVAIGLLAAIRPRGSAHLLC